MELFFVYWLTPLPLFPRTMMAGLPTQPVGWETLAAVCVALAAIIMMVNQATKLVDWLQVRKGSGRIDVSIQGQLATKEDVNELDEKFKERMRRQEDDLATFRAEVKADENHLHTKINGFVGKLEKMDGSVEAIRETLNRLLDLALKKDDR